jgi:hypothetical protein
VGRVGPLAVPRGHVQAHERLARFGNAGDKNDRLPPAEPRDVELEVDPGDGATPRNPQAKT